MTMQISSKMARLSARLVAIGQRHADLEDRIAQVQRRPHRDQLVLTRLKREKLRLKEEMYQYEGVLRTLARGVPA